MPPQKIIIDTDPGVDDVLAILMALASPELSVSLISIVFGNTHAPIARSNLLKIYHALAKELAEVPGAVARYGRLAEREKTVLAVGEDGPIGGEKAVAAYFHGRDGLSNITETHPCFTPPVTEDSTTHAHLKFDQRPAWQVILEMLKTEPEGTLSIVALGPLTNLAHALREDPLTFSRVASVVWMGGALEHPGNTSPVAEFNCFADPYAAEQVLTAVKAGAFDMIMCPLDITTPHQIPFSDLIHPSFVPSTDASSSLPTAPSPGPLRSFVSAMLVRVRGLQANFGLADVMEMHDPTAVWYALSNTFRSPTGPAPGWVVQPRDFIVERKGEYTRGMCVVDRRGTQESGQNRTEDPGLQDHQLPEKKSREGESRLPPTVDSVLRMGKEVVGAAKLPHVVTGTPGPAVLREMLLARVFGNQA